MYCIITNFTHQRGAVIVYCNIALMIHTKNFETKTLKPIIWPVYCLSTFMLLKYRPSCLKITTLWISSLLRLGAAHTWRHSELRSVGLTWDTAAAADPARPTRHNIFQISSKYFLDDPPDIFPRVARVRADWLRQQPRSVGGGFGGTGSDFWAAD